MKKLLLSVLTITTLGFGAKAQTWQNVGVPEFSSGHVSYTDIALDNAGVKYVAFQDFGNGAGGKVTVMKFNGTNWVNVGNAGFSAGLSEYVNLAIDGTTPYVVYKDGGNSNKTSVMKFDGTNWVYVGSAGLSYGASEFQDIKVYNNMLYVTYSESHWSNKVCVRTFDGTNWVDLGFNGGSLSGGTARYLDLEIDNNVFYVAYRDYSQGSKTTVMKYDPLGSPSWVPVGAAGFSNGVASYQSLYIDNGTLYVSFQDNTQSFKATVMKFDGTNWVNVGNAGFTPSGAEYHSLVVDNGTPYLAFMDYSVSAPLYRGSVMKFDGASWSNVGSVGFTPDRAMDISMIISDGILMMSFKDNGTSTPYGVSVMSTCVTTSVLATSTNSQTITANENSAGVTYQWIDCNNNNAIIVGETTQSYTATTNGNYACEITNGCNVDTTACVSITTVGINENSINNKVIVYPNPATSQLTIENKDLKILSILVLDITGKTVKTIVSNNNTIDVSNLVKGIYFLQIQTNKGMLNSKFIKE